MAADAGGKLEFVDLKAQYRRLKPAIDVRIQKVLDHGQYILGPEVAELESRLAEYVGARHCVGVSDGTTALQIALMALGIGPGDEVITTPFTFIATAETIALVGAKPVFVDIDARTYNIDPARIETAITPRTKAIMPVSLYGQCADFDALNAIGERWGLPIIEDGAQSFGAVYKGRRSCGLSTIGSTSFFPSKPLGCYGDGGALFTNDDAIAKTIREIRVHGQDRRYHHPIIGVNGRLDTIQAAVLLAKMDVFQQDVEARGAIGARYTEEISKRLCTRVRTPWLAPGCSSVYAQYTVGVQHRDDVAAELNKAGIPTAIHYPVPLHLQPAFASLGLREGAFPISERAARSVLSLPMHPELRQLHVDRIADALTAAVNTAEARASSLSKVA